MENLERLHSNGIELYMVGQVLIGVFFGFLMIIGAVAILRKILDKYFGGI